MSVRERFVERYGGIYEHSRWVAERAFKALPADADQAAIRAALAASVDGAGRAMQLELIRAHPDLAGRAALAGSLTRDSTDEQQSAGIDQCSEEELARFHDLNSRYKKKFGFPFVMAVRGRQRSEILAAFEQRLAGSPDAEFARALEEIHKIAGLRLEELESVAGRKQGLRQGSIEC